jgi:hypothetical protein
MINREFLNANHAALVAEILAEGQKAGRAEGVGAGAKTERERIQAVQKAALPGCEQLVATLMFDGKTSGPEAAEQCIAHYKSQNTGALGKLTKDAKALPAIPATPSATGDLDAQAAAAEAALPLEERCQKRWERDAQVRADFTSVEAYTAYEKAMASGKVKILGKHKAA